MRIQVKVCGVASREDAQTACDLGADAVGFVFAKSPRRVSIEHANTMARHLPSPIARVAVLREPTEEELNAVLFGFEADIVQVEPTTVVLRRIQSTRIQLLPVLHDDPTLNNQLTRLQQSEARYSSVILEAPGRGGRGISPNWSHAADLARQIRLVLAGGLTPANVGDAIHRVQPIAVDVSSGVEVRPGVKCPKLMTEFMEAVKNAERSPGTLEVR